MNDLIFKQYDIRGKVGSELLIEEAYQLGLALAYFFKQQNSLLKAVSLGMDGRIHSPLIKEELSRAFLDSGINVIFIGTCPTPVLYFSLFNLEVQAGIIITASHNGKEYNGLKICMNKESVWGSQIQEIKQLYKDKKSVPLDKKGTYSTIDMIEVYIQWLKEHFKHLIGMKLPVLIDCGNGAAGTVLPELIKQMEWQSVDLLYQEVDGTYPHHEADPTVEKNMQDLRKIITTKPYQFGIGLDGDCDRMAPMTKEGSIVAGDKLLALFSCYLIKNNPDATIIFDIKCSSGLPEVLDSIQAKWIMSPSGHAIIKNQMKINKALLAGELSCHFFFKDRYFGYDDGIYALLRLFEILVQSGKNLSQLLTIFPEKYNTPEYRIACDQQQINLILTDIVKAFEHDRTVQLMTIDGIRVIMKEGWGLIRPSHTQPVICIRFEADSRAHLERIKQTFINLMSPHINNSCLAELC